MGGVARVLVISALSNGRGAVSLYGAFAVVLFIEETGYGRGE